MMSTGAGTTSLPYIPEGVQTPVFWGSFLGILVGSVVAGFRYLGILGSSMPPAQASSSALEPRPLIVIFCCLLCVRYYASIIFLSYDDVTSPRVRTLETRARRVVFAVQLFLVVACGVNIAVLPTFGAVAATGIIIAQAASVGLYWKHLWRLLLKGPEGNFRLLLGLGDLTILVSAVTFFTWEIGWYSYDATGAGMCMGAIFIIFVGECITTYRQAIILFSKKTAEFLS